MSKHSVRQFTPARLVLGSAAAVLVALVAWVAVRAGGPANAADDPVMVQPSGLPVAVQSALPPSPPPSAPPASSASPSASRSPSASPSSSASASPSASRKPKKSKSPTPSASVTPSPSRTSAPPPPPADDLEATYTTTAAWRDGLIGNVRIVNTGTTARDFTVTITYGSGTDLRLRSAWNSAGDSSGNRITLRGTNLGPGASINAGFQAEKNRDGGSRASGCTVSGGSCNVS